MDEDFLSTKALLEKAQSIAADAETRAEAASRQVSKQGDTRIWRGVSKRIRNESHEKVCNITFELPKL